ncbi:hypothetical protein LJR231_004178 [Phyllobacterium sp. LjRoot231]|uniref:hypothetical protein n=1 Tax=Phyllobacterium sp. LjRoot231 TaxID=3342289 RepID=UPI003ED08369
MGDISNPAELYWMMQDWLKSFQDDPGRNAKPYYVTLAPITIANGPMTPNSAKHRSRIIDGMNLMEFIIQNPTRYEFVAPTTLTDIVKAFQGYQVDLDLVAAAASAAINDVTKALTPADFAMKIGTTYPQGMEPSPMPTLEKGAAAVLASKGQEIIAGDPLFSVLRERLKTGAAQLGFDLGAGLSEGHTLWGPGKQAFMEALSADQQASFKDAVDFALERNANVDFARVGARIAAADSLVQAERSREPLGHFTIGFDSATGIYGDPKLGVAGNTATGPGAFAIRDKLTAGGQRGFNAVVAYHLSRTYVD